MRLYLNQKQFRGKENPLDPLTQENSLNPMKLIKYKCGLISIVTFTLFQVGILQAQDRFTAEAYLTMPEKYNGKKVTINVGWVDVPAIYANDEKGYRDFLVFTCAQQQNQSGVSYIPRGQIVMRVPTSDAEAFVRRHGTTYNKMWYGNNNRGNNRVRQVTGVFRQMKSVYGGYLDLTDGSFGDYEPRVCWLNGRYVRSPNSDEPVPVGQTKAER